MAEMPTGYNMETALRKRFLIGREYLAITLTNSNLFLEVLE